MSENNSYYRTFAPIVCLDSWRSHSFLGYAFVAEYPAVKPPFLTGSHLTYNIVG